MHTLHQYQEPIPALLFQNQSSRIITKHKHKFVFCSPTLLPMYAWPFNAMGRLPKLSIHGVCFMLALYI
jgi:hypothetical protein